MKVTTQPVEPAATPPTLVESTPTARSEAVQLHGSTPASFLQSSFPKSSFLGLGPLLSRGRSNEESSSGLLEAEGPNAGLVPSVVEHLPGPAVTGSDLSSQRSLHRKSQHQSPLFRPPTDPTNSQASGIATASAALTRRDSQEDIEIQRGIFPIRSLFAAHHDYSTREDRRGFFVNGEFGGVCGHLAEIRGAGRVENKDHGPSIVFARSIMSTIFLCL